jgi:hypothetical protein
MGPQVIQVPPGLGYDHEVVKDTRPKSSRSEGASYVDVVASGEATKPEPAYGHRAASGTIEHECVTSRLRGQDGSGIRGGWRRDGPLRVWGYCHCGSSPPRSSTMVTPAPPSKGSAK